MHRLSVAIFLLLLGGALVSAQPLPPPGSWTIHSKDLDMDPSGRITFTNRLFVKYGAARLTADRGTLDQNSGIAEVDGNVRLENQGQIFLSENLKFNFLTGRVLGRDMRTRQGALLVRSHGIAGDRENNIYVGAKNLLTADDYAEPSYSLRAETLIIVPGQYLEAKNATLRLGNVPVFYFPRYRRSLAATAPQLELTPGYRSQHGLFLLAGYNWTWNEKLDGTLHIDGRQKRGVGFGPDFNWHLGRWGEGTFQTYYARDLEPGTDLLDRDIDEERYRFHFAHIMSPLTNLYVRGVLRYQSDPLVLRDFFEGEYKDNIQPSTYLEVNRFFLRNYNLDVLVQPRINDFFETVERLPDIRLTGYRQQIGATPLYYESESSVAYLRRKFAEGDTNDMFGAMRADTLQQVVLPQTLFGWLIVTPRVGARFTHYGEAEGPGAMTDEENRGVFNTGAEASFKASQLWAGARSKFWDVNGLRHILRPSVNYAYVPHPTVAPRELPQFDYTIPTTRLLPIDFPDFNAIDEVDSQNVLRLGLQNKLQTKRFPNRRESARLSDDKGRERQVENIVDWELFADYRITRRTGQPSFSDLFSEMDLRPFSWLTLSSEIRYGLSQTALQETYHRLALTPNSTWSAAIGHRFLRDDPQFGEDFGHNLIATTFYYRLNDNWGVRTSHHFEARDGTLEEQYYTLYRDFRSWTGALTFRLRDNREGPTDFTVAFTFNLKAFPRFDLRDDVIRPSKLVGR